jgi:hypothetical protein
MISRFVQKSRPIQPTIDSETHACQLEVKANEYRPDDS